MEIESILQKLETDPEQGLSLEEAQRRLGEYGYNELGEEAKTSPFILFLNQFKNTLIVILIAATVLSALIGDLLDAGIILAIVVFCALVGIRAGVSRRASTGCLEENANPNNYSPQRRKRA